jgi:hypothetical protein
MFLSFHFYFALFFPEHLIRKNISWLLSLIGEFLFSGCIWDFFPSLHCCTIAGVIETMLKSSRITYFTLKTMIARI